MDLKNLLGLAGYQAYERYHQHRRHWQQVEHLASRLYDSDAPLTPLQAESLGEILIAHADESNRPGTQPVANGEAAISQAALVLSPPQLEMLQAIRDSQRLWLQIQRLRAKEAQAAKRP